MENSKRGGLSVEKLGEFKGGPAVARYALPIRAPVATNIPHLIEGQTI